MSAPDPASVVLVLSTAPSTEVAELIGRALVEERLAACANILEGVTSIYRWNGAMQSEAEVLMLIKTTAGLEERLRARLVELHPYDVPEALAFSAVAGDPAYMTWIHGEVGRNG